MAWCEPCSKFFNPRSTPDDGTCPDCGAVLEPEHAAHVSVDTDEGHDIEPLPKVPWHFWLGVAAMVGYLGWRLIEGIVWVFT